MKDIQVNSWNELMEVLYDIPKNSYHRHRSRFVYRGLADKSWGLQTSLQRLGVDKMTLLEKPLLRSFKKFAESGSIPGNSIWIQLSVAQHHGLPTRVLDWTISPQIALHFATAEEEYYDKDAAIWCINLEETWKFLPKKLLDILGEEYAFIFSVDMLDSIKSLKEFDDLGKFVLFFEPPSLDSRIINQWGIMSVMSGSDLFLDDFLKDHESIYSRIIIPKEIKWEVRDKLDQNNVTERMLFPGLDGLSRWLKRYYGPGPVKMRK